VNARAKPLHDVSCLVAQWHLPMELPTELSIRPPHACFTLKRLPGIQGQPPLAHDLLNIVRMNEVGPAPPAKFFQGSTEIIQHPLVEEIDVAIGKSAVEQGGCCVDHQPKAIFSSLEFIDVVPRSIPLHDPALLIPQGHVPKQKPAILPVHASHARLVLKRLPASQPRMPN